MSSADAFWDVREQEATAIRDLDRRIAAMDLERRVLREVAALDGDPRWQAYRRALGEMQKDAENRLIACSVDADIHRLQGRIMAIREMAGMCSDWKVRADRLDAVLLEAQTRKKQSVLPDGKVIPQGTQAWLGTTTAPVQPR